MFCALVSLSSFASKLHPETEQMAGENDPQVPQQLMAKNIIGEITTEFQCLNTLNAFSLLLLQYIMKKTLTLNNF